MLPERRIRRVQRKHHGAGGIWLLKNSLRYRVIWNGIYVGIARVIRSGGPILLTPMFLRAWGISLYGDWLAVSAYSAAFMLLQDGGVSMSLANAMGMLRRGDESTAWHLQKMALWFAASVALVIATAGIVLLSVLQNWFHSSEMQEANVSFVFSIQLAACVLSLLTAALVGSFRFAADERAFLRISGMAAFAEMVGVGIALGMSAGPVLVAAIFLAVRLLQFGSTYIAARQRLPACHTGRISVAQYRPYVMPSLGFALLPIIATLQNQAPLILIHGTFGAPAASLFQVTRTYANSLQLVSGTIYSAILPEFPKLWSEGKTETLKAAYQKALRYTLLVTLALGTILLVCGPAVYSVWTQRNLAFPIALGLALVASAGATSMLNCAMVVPRATNRVHAVSIALLALTCVALGVMFVSRNILPLEVVPLLLMAVESVSAVLVVTNSRRWLRVSQLSKKTLPQLATAA